MAQAGWTESEITVLRPHLALPHFVNLEGRLWPGSIRDQALRALLVTDALWKAGHLRPGMRILVVGAGVAGLFSALRMAELGLDVWLVDDAPDALSLMRENTARLVSPTIYDWPCRRWLQPVFEGSPLDYREDPPAKIAHRWTSKLHNARPCLRWHPNVECTWIGNNGPPWPVEFASTKQGLTLPTELTGAPFDVVFACRGIGAQSEQPLAWGPPGHRPQAFFPMFHFWEDDCYPGKHQSAVHLEELKPLEAHDPNQARVVIVGAGDGGLQDLFRFLTGGLPVRDILNRIVDALQGEQSSYRILYRLLDSENRTGRHYTTWSREESAGLIYTSDAEFRESIEDLYLHNRQRHEVLRATLDELVTFRDVVVFHRLSALGRCYPLNRFLAVLFDLYLRERGRSTFQFGWTCTSVVCAEDDHNTRSQSPVEHYAGKHLVTFENQEGSTRTVLCRAVVSRIGPVPAQGASELRQSLPYWLPGWRPVSEASPGYPARSLSGALRDDHGARQALWRSMIGIAVLKNSEGRVFAMNRRFADLMGRTHTEIIGRTASEYGDAIEGMRIEQQDALVRSRLINYLTWSEAGGKRHFTFRYPLPSDHHLPGAGASQGPGSASLGFDLTDVGSAHRYRNDLEEPSAKQLERFFEWTPCSLAITDKVHRYVYGNQAFRRLFAPPGCPALPVADLYGLTWDEVVARLRIPGAVEDQSNDRKKAIWSEKKVAQWDSFPPFSRKNRMVIGFPLYDETGKMIALASVGFRNVDVVTAEKPGGYLHSVEYPLELLEEMRRPD